MSISLLSITGRKDMVVVCPPKPLSSPLLCTPSKPPPRKAPPPPPARGSCTPSCRSVSLPFFCCVLLGEGATVAARSSVWTCRAALVCAALASSGGARHARHIRIKSRNGPKNNHCRCPRKWQRHAVRVHRQLLWRCAHQHGQVKAGTELGKQAQACMSAGQLVPDELVIAIVAEKLQQPDVISKGWLLDGFPRTPAQATALAAAGVTPDVFLLLDVPDEALVERICFRRTDPVTGKIYHLKFNPPPEDVKDRLQHRSDDTEEALRTRLVQYHGNIDGIKGFYEKVSVKINGHSEGASFKDNVARVQGELRAAIDARSA